MKTKMCSDCGYIIFNHEYESCPNCGGNELLIGELRNYEEIEGSKNRYHENSVEPFFYQKLRTDINPLISSYNYVFMNKDLREKQVQYMSLCYEGLINKVPVIIEGPTGLGKTRGLIGAFIPLLNQNFRVIYSCKTIPQLRQFVEELRNIFSSNDEPFSIVSVATYIGRNSCMEYICKEKSCDKCGKSSVMKFKNNFFLDFEGLRDVYKDGFCPYSTCREGIVKEADIVVCTYTYLLSEIERRKIFDSSENVLLIVDEAHNFLDLITEKPYLTVKCVPNISERGKMSFGNKVLNLVEEILVWLGIYKPDTTEQELSNYPENVYFVPGLFDKIKDSFLKNLRVECSKTLKDLYPKKDSLFEELDDCKDDIDRLKDKKNKAYKKRGKALELRDKCPPGKKRLECRQYYQKQQDKYFQQYLKLKHELKEEVKRKKEINIKICIIRKRIERVKRDRDYLTDYFSSTLNFFDYPSVMPEFSSVEMLYVVNRLIVDFWYAKILYQLNEVLVDSCSNATEIYYGDGLIEFYENLNQEIQLRQKMSFKELARTMKTQNDLLQEIADECHQDIPDDLKIKVTAYEIFKIGFNIYLKDLKDFVGNYIKSNRFKDKDLDGLNSVVEDLKKKDSSIEIACLSNILNTLSMLDSWNFYVTVENEGELYSFKIHMIHPVRWVKEIFSDFYSVVFTSGTLSPPEDIARLLGVKNVLCKRVEPIFEESNYLPYVVLGVHSGFKEELSKEERFFSSEIEVIDEVLHTVLSSTNGNVGIFCGSKDVLDSLLDKIGDVCRSEGRYFLIGDKSYVKEGKEGIDDFEILKGKASSGVDRLEVYKELCRKKKGLVLLGITGGKFAEGIDYPGQEMEIAIIIGIPYKDWGKEKEINELKEDYFNMLTGDRNLSQCLAYKYDALRKITQTAGRIHRQNTDKGVIVFLDERLVGLKNKNPADPDKYEFLSPKGVEKNWNVMQPQIDKRKRIVVPSLIKDSSSSGKLVGHLKKAQPNVKTRGVKEMGEEISHFLDNN